MHTFRFIGWTQTIFCNKIFSDCKIINVHHQTIIFNSRANEIKYFFGNTLNLVSVYIDLNCLFEFADDYLVKSPFLPFDGQGVLLANHQYLEMGWGRDVGLGKGWDN